jgi:tripartite ATP-independent transporter DctP family solute receptor
MSATLFAQATAETAAAKPVVLKYGHIWASETRMNKAVLMVADLVKERSNGALTIDVFPGEQLGSQFEEMENVKQGLQDMTMVYGIDRYCPDFSLFNTPFVFRDEVHQYEVCMNSELTKDMVRQYMIDNHNIRLLNMFYHGPRMLSTSAAKPVKSPKDVVGLKLRTPDITAWINSWKSIGANVTVFPWGELYLALKQGIVEAQENPLGSINDMKFYEVQKNIVLTAHIIDYPFVMINEAKFQSLGPELQKILTDAIQEAHEWVLAEGKKEEAKMIDFFRSQGLNIVEIDKAEWIAAFSKTPDMFPNGRAIWEAIQAVK